MKTTPFLNTGHETIDDAFRVALGDLLSNIGAAKKGMLTENAPVIKAGMGAVTKVAQAWAMTWSPAGRLAYFEPRRRAFGSDNTP